MVTFRMVLSDLQIKTYRSALKARVQEIGRSCFVVDAADRVTPIDCLIRVAQHPYGAVGLQNTCQDRVLLGKLSTLLKNENEFVHGSRIRGNAWMWICLSSLQAWGNSVR